MQNILVLGAMVGSMALGIAMLREPVVEDKWKPYPWLCRTSPELLRPLQELEELMQVLNRSAAEALGPVAEELAAFDWLAASQPERLGLSSNYRVAFLRDLMDKSLSRIAEIEFHVASLGFDVESKSNEVKKAAEDIAHNVRCAILLS